MQYNYSCTITVAYNNKNATGSDVLIENHVLLIAAKQVYYGAHDSDIKIIIIICIIMVRMLSEPRGHRGRTNSATPQRTTVCV